MRIWEHFGDQSKQVSGHESEKARVHVKCFIKSWTR